MALGVNQTYKNYYTVRLGSLTTQHSIQANRLTLFTNEVTDIASKINFFENQKVLTLATPDNSKLAIDARYFDLPKGFVASDQTTWGTDGPKYTTPCQKQLFIYKKINATEAAKYSSSTITDYYYAGNCLPEKDSSGTVTQYWAKIPYTKSDYDSDGTLESTEYDGGNNSSITGTKPAAGTMATDAQNIMDSRILSNRLMTGEYTFVYTDDTGTRQVLSYKDLTFINESQDKTAYQETIQNLEAERHNIQQMQKGVQQEMQTTEVQIQAFQSMMESTEKVLQKNTESFKWGA